MIRRIITRLILTSLIPMAVKAGKNLLSKRKSNKNQTNLQSGDLETSANREFVETGDEPAAVQPDVTGTNTR